MHSSKNKANSDIFFSVTDKNSPVAEVPVTFFAPNGWSKTVITDKEGNVTFAALWEGNYLVETYKVDAVENEADFNKKHRIVTTVLNIQ